jgi:alpha-beta hydrolase superfamily lysophospholipase
VRDWRQQRIIMADARRVSSPRSSFHFLLPAILACVLATGACAPVTFPAGPPSASPRIEMTPPSTAKAEDNPPSTSPDKPFGQPAALGEITAADGFKLPLRAWLPENDKPKAIIIGIHGFNDYSNAFDMPARWWAEQGIATFAYDQRGFGEAANRGYWSSTETMDQDLGEAARLLATRYPGVPLYYLGESMGAAVVMTALADRTVPAPAGTILVAPAVWSRSYMPFYQRWALWLASHVVPWMTFTGRGLGIMPSDNIPMLQAFSRDPLSIKETRSDAIKGLVDLMDAGQTAAAQVTGPTLVLIGAHDQLVPLKAQWAAVEALPDPARQRAAYYKDGWHMLMRDIEGPLLWNDVSAWIADHDAPLPSSADAAAKTERAARTTAISP